MKFDEEEQAIDSQGLATGYPQPTQLRYQIEQLQAQLAALELEREALRAALHGVIDEMAWAEFDPEDDDCWYGDSIKLLSQPPEYWAQKVKEEK